jgi:enolase-phosphatase E1
MSSLPTASFSGISVVLLDIEGTVSDIRFVYDVMFPYAQQNMASFLKMHWNESAVQVAIQQVCADANQDPQAWLGSSMDQAQQTLMTHLHQLMANDSKSTGLKAIQGLVWKDGFESGAIRAELFDDVLPALEKWKASGMMISIYSSGSILAQQLFFGHTIHGDVTPLLSDYFDTTTGPKRESSSYASIAQAMKIPSSAILFVSDIAEELMAAMDAGFQVVASVRPNNKPLLEIYSGPAVSSFADIAIG